MKRLMGQVAMVTNASTGVGALIAQSLANEGAAVVVHYNGSLTNAHATTDEWICV